MQKSASAMAAAGNTLEETIGMATAMNAIVQDPNSVGTMLKTLSMFLRAAKTEAEEAGIETDGMADSVSKLRGQIESLTGVDIMIDDTQFKSTYQIMKEISEVWDSLTDVTQANVLNLIGGKRNANSVVALIKNFQEAAEAAETAMNSTGSAVKENEKYLDSINGKLTQLKGAFEEMSTSILDSEVVKFFISLATEIVKVSTALSKVGLFIPALSSIGAIIDSISKRSKISEVASSFDKWVLSAKNNADGYKTTIDALTGATETFGKSQDRMLYAMISQRESFAGLDVDTQKAIKGLLGIDDAAKVATKGFKGVWESVKTGFSSLSLLSKISVGIGAVSVAISAVSAIINAVRAKNDAIYENAEKITEAYKNSKKTMDDNIASLDKLRARYNQLSAGVDVNGKNVSLTANEYEEYLSIIDQIVDISPDIVTGYDNEGNAILKYRDAIDEAIKSQKELNELNTSAYVGDGEDIFKRLKAEYVESKKDLKSFSSDFKDAFAYDPDSIWPSTFNRAYALENVIKDMGIANVYDYDNWLLNPDIMEELYNRADEFISLLQDTGEYDESFDFTKALVTLKSISGTLDEVNNQKSEAINWIMAYAQEAVGDTKWVDDIPLGALDEFENSLLGVVDLTKSSSENYDLATEKAKQYIDILDQAQSGGLINQGLNVDSREDVEAYNKSVSEYIQSLKEAGIYDDSVISAAEQYFNSIVTWIDKTVAHTEHAKVSIESYGDILKQLGDNVDILNAAEKDMNENGSVSSETAQKIMAALGADEKLTDYLYMENGVLKLNTELWRERAKNSYFDSIKDTQSYIDDLKAQKAELYKELSSDPTVANPEENSRYSELADINAKIDAAEEELEIYKSLYDAVTNISDIEALGLDEFMSSLDAIDSKANTLYDTLEGIKKGKALTPAALYDLEKQFPEMLSYINEYEISTQEGQVALLEKMIGLREEEYDAAIDAQIAALEASKTEEGVDAQTSANIDNVITELEKLKSMSLSELRAETKDTKSSMEKLSDGIGDVKNAAELLGDIKSGESLLDTISSIADFVDSHEGYSLSDFFNDDGSLKSNEELYSNILHRVMNSLEKLDGYNPEWGDTIRAEFEKIVNGEEEAVKPLEELSKVIAKTGNINDLWTKALSANSDPTEILDSVIDLVDGDLEKFQKVISGFGSDGSIIFAGDAFDTLTSSVFDNNDALKELEKTYPGVTEWIKKTAQANYETAVSYDKLDSAIDVVSKASGLIKDIRGGEADFADMFGSIVEIAKESGQSINDFYSITGDKIVWNENAIIKWAESYVDTLGDIKDVTPETIAMLKDMIVTEEAAQSVSEKLKTGYENIGKAVSNFDSLRNQAELTYSSLMELVEIDKRYADTLEYSNGMMTVNAQKYGEVTQAIIDENKAQAQIQLEAALADRATLELMSRTNGLSDAQKKRMETLNVEIAGYATLISELNNATNAYNAFINASSDTDSSRYSAAFDALKVITDTLDNKESDLYGKVGREQFQAALRFLVRPEIDVDSPEFDAEIKKLKRYITEDGTGITNFYNDLLKSGFVGEDGVLRATAEDIEEALGISEEALRTLEAQYNEYYSDPDYQLHLFDDGIIVNEDAIEQSVAKAQRYINDVMTFYDDLKTEGLINDGELTQPIDEIARKLGVSVSVVESLLDELNGYLSEDQEVKTTGLDNAGDSAGNVGDEAADSKKSVEELTAEINVMKGALDTVNSTGVNVSTGGSIKNINSVNSALGNIVNTLERIRKNSDIRVNITQTTTQVVNRVGNILGGLFGGSSSASGGFTKGGRTLVGELGMETVVDPSTNRWYTVGDNGAEFVMLPKNAIVFNAKQTEELLGHGKTNSRGDAMASGNAALNVIGADVGGKTGSWLKNVAKDVKKTAEKTAKKIVNDTLSVVGYVTGAVTGTVTKTGQAPATSNKTSSSKTSTNSGSSSSSKKSGSGSGSSKSSASLDKLKEQYEELNKQSEHLIEHQEFIYTQAERGYDYTGMEKSLEEQARLYKKIMEDSQKGIDEMIAKGADDTSEELQSLEKAYWSAYNSMYEKLDQINTMYADALNQKIDDLQNAYSSFASASKEYSDVGGISIDSFQKLMQNGGQYMSLLDKIDGQYVVNKEGLERMISAEKEQLAVESALSYVGSLKSALDLGDTNAVDRLVDSTEKISDNVWDSVYAQAAALKQAGMTDEQYSQIIKNIDAMRAIAGNVIIDITKDMSGAAKTTNGMLNDQKEALDDILDLVQDLIKYETNQQIDAIEKQIDEYKKIIDLKKESLRTTKEEDDYDKSVAEKVKEIAATQVKIDKLSLDSSREAQAERAALIEELNKLQDDLSEEQADHAYNAQVDALDKMAEDYETMRQSEIDGLEESISSAEKLYQAAIQRIETGWDTLYHELIEWNTESGNSLNSEITESWKKAEEAAREYGSAVKAIRFSNGEVGGDISDKIIVADDLPHYHSGGTVGDAGSINDSEVLAVLKKGEYVVENKNSLYKIIDFQKTLSEKLGRAIGTIEAPIARFMSSVGIGRSPVQAVAAGVGNVTFSPRIDVNIDYKGGADAAAAEKFGKTIANAAMNELYGSFERKGVTSLFGAKLK